MEKTKRGKNRIVLGERVEGRKEEGLRLEHTCIYIYIERGKKIIIQNQTKQNKVSVRKTKKEEGRRKRYLSMMS
jgi:hypothetical protein